MTERNKPATLEELYPGISTEGPSREEQDAAFQEAYPGAELPSTAGEAVRETFMGGAQGLTRSAPMVAGAIGGLKAGAPLGPYGMVGGMIAGGTAGYFAGREAEKLFPEVSRYDLVPYREGGKTFGDSIAAAPMAFNIPVMTANRVAQFVSGVGEAARRSPKAFLAAEASGAAGAGLGAGMAEAYDPGAPGTRFLAETAGGFFSPTRVVAGGSAMAMDGLRSIKGAFSAGSREARAANRLYSILEEVGEDIPTLIRRLEAEMPIDQIAAPGQRITPTSAQKTGSLALSEMETSLGRAHAKFLGETNEQGRQALRAYQLMVDRLKAIGTPEALYTAAQMQEQRFGAMLNGRLALADANAAEKIGRISRDTPQARRSIGEIVKGETETALRSARDYEQELWKRGLSELTRRPVDMPPGVPLNVVQFPRMAPSNTVQDYLRYTLDIGDAVYDKNTPAVVKSIMSKFGVTPDAVKRYKAGRRSEEFALTGEIPARFLPSPKEVDLSEMVNYRSNLLTMAREAAGKGDVSNANFYSTIADSLMKDLSTVNNPAFDEARSFSKALNDTFTRTFARTAAESADVTARGAQRLPAEVLVTRAFGHNADVTAMRMEEIQDAVRFMAQRYDDTVQRFGADSAQALALKPMADMSRQGAASVADAHSRVLRMAAAQSIDTAFDPATGREVTRLNTQKLQRFVAENKTMLDQLGITPDLTDAVRAENAFRMMQNQNSDLMKRAADQYAFGQVLKAGGERTSTVIGTVLNSSTPVRDMKNLVKLAQEGGPEAVRGLKSSLYDYAYLKASRGDGTSFSPRAFEESFFQPLAPNQPSLANIMRSNGLMTLTELKNMKRLIDPMKRIEAAMANPRTMDEVVPGSDAITELAQRVIGARIGSAASPNGPGVLIAASAGSKAVRQIFDKMPTVSTRGILERASQDPQFMALLLRKGTTDRDRINIARQLHGYMLMSGLNYATFDEPEPEQSASPGAPFRPGGQAAQALRQLPAAPSTRGVPFMSQAQAAQPPEGQGPQGGAAGPGGAPAAPGQASSMFQQLFPFDSVSPMLGQQGMPQQ
jgi:hypothetical protein